MTSTSKFSGGTRIVCSFSEEIRVAGSTYGSIDNRALPQIAIFTIFSLFLKENSEPKNKGQNCGSDSRYSLLLIIYKKQNKA